jgi:hypothetical protein
MDHPYVVPLRNFQLAPTCLLRAVARYTTFCMRSESLLNRLCGFANRVKLSDQSAVIYTIRLHIRHKFSYASHAYTIDQQVQHIV